MYQEILQYSFQDYYNKFVIPYYQSRGLAPPAGETLQKAGDLRTYEDGLRANPGIRVIDNQNDFLLADEDLCLAARRVWSGPLDHLFPGRAFRKSGQSGSAKNHCERA